MIIQYQIRQMQEKDLEQVTALEASCFSRPWKYKDFEDTLTNPDRFYFVADTGKSDFALPGSILGGCMLTNVAGEGELSNVAVQKAYRRNKIASALLLELLAFGETQCGITAFTLEVRSKNIAARGLYEKFGFISVGIRPNFYDLPKDDAVIMWRNDKARLRTY